MSIVKRIQSLKDNKVILLALIIMNSFLTYYASRYHWSHLKTTPIYLLPFVPICASIALLFFLCYFAYYLNKKIPPWLATFTILMAVAYGIAAAIFYPLVMGNYGVTSGKVGSLFFLILHVFEAAVISDYLLPISWWKYLIMMVYLGIKDYCDYVLNTFHYFQMKTFPLWIKGITPLVVIPAQLIVLFFLIWAARRNKASLRKQKKKNLKRKRR